LLAKAYGRFLETRKSLSLSPFDRVRRLHSLCAHVCVFMVHVCTYTKTRVAQTRRSLVRAREARERERERETGHRDSASKNSWLGYREKSLFL